MKNEHSQSEAEKQDFITILKTGDQVKISMAKAILDAENIVYLVKNEIVQDLFGLGKVGGYNYLLGPMELQVENDRVEEAKKLLANLTANQND